VEHLLEECAALTWWRQQGNINEENKIEKISSLMWLDCEVELHKNQGDHVKNC
jgi:hypothetical protein